MISVFPATHLASSKLSVQGSKLRALASVLESGHPHHPNLPQTYLQNYKERTFGYYRVIIVTYFV